MSKYFLIFIFYILFPILIGLFSYYFVHFYSKDRQSVMNVEYVILAFLWLFGYLFVLDIFSPRKKVI